MADHNHLHLKAETEEDLKIISGAAQDSILRVEGIIYDQTSRSIMLGFQRFRHEANKASRVLSGLRFDGVLSVKSMGIDKTKKDAFLVLLSIEFSETDKPAGEVILNFSGNGQMSLSVECLEVMLSDQGDPWLTKAVPEHAV